MARELTPFEVSIFDQAMAKASGEYGELLAAARELSAEFGQTPALVALMGEVVNTRRPSDVLMLLMSVLLRDTGPAEEEVPGYEAQ